MNGRLAAFAALVAAGLASCRPSAPPAGPGAAATDSGIAESAMAVDSLVGVAFVSHAGDRQRLLRGCPGADCEVGAMVRLEPAERANEKGDTATILARMINEDTVYWADPASGLSFGPRGSGFDTVFVRVHAPDAGPCTVEYRYRADLRAERGDTVITRRPEAVRPPTCSLPAHGIRWKQPTARFLVGSTAVWMSCRRGCCQAS